MSKHTAGPWETGKGYGRYGVEIVGNDGNRLVCGVIGVERDLKDKEGRVVASAQDFEGWANARLIAAAPELLEALQVIVANANGRPMQTGYYDVPAGSIDAARTIIAKATGAAE